MRASLTFLAISAALLSWVTPASAVVTSVTEGSTTTIVGLQPRTEQLVTPAVEPEAVTNNVGNAVLHGTSDYVIYWDPNALFHHEWLVNLDGFFHDMGETPSEALLSTPFGTLGQYRDRSNVVKPFQALFKGAYSDTTKYPTAGCPDPHVTSISVTCLTDAQLREQLQQYITGKKLPTGMNVVYFVLTPPGVTVCLSAAGTHCSDYSLSTGEANTDKRESVSYQNSFCSYHGDINPGNSSNGDANTILYAAIPWTAGRQGLETFPAGYSSALTYAQAFDCQDGGWSPVNKKGEREETRETPTEPPTKEEEEILKGLKGTPEEKQNLERRRVQEGPHEQEPNQEAKDEEGDYGAGLTDILVNQIAEEEINTVTDPLLTSWKNGKGDEVTDICRDAFSSTAGPSGGTIGGALLAQEHTEAGTLSNVIIGSGHYYINNVFNLGGRCVGGVGLVARFTPPNPVNTNEVVTVDGMESTVGLLKGLSYGPSGPPTTTYATFSWNFGDGTPEVKGYAPGAPQCEPPWLSPCAASAIHTYQYGGTYNITLKIEDVGGNTTSVTHSITVAGTPSSSNTPGSGPSSGAVTSTASSTSSSNTGSSSKGTAAAAPVAAQSVLSTSLVKATRKGLPVRYSVNEQVAGSFNVLLEASIAKRLGLHFPLATGLPEGTAPQEIVGKAVVVTTKGGRGTIKIQFGRRTGTLLRRLHKVSLLVQLHVRSASGMTTTVLSKITLY